MIWVVSLKQWISSTEPFFGIVLKAHLYFTSTELMKGYAYKITVNYFHSIYQYTCSATQPKKYGKSYNVKTDKSSVTTVLASGDACGGRILICISLREKRKEKSCNTLCNSICINSQPQWQAINTDDNNNECYLFLRGKLSCLTSTRQQHQNTQKQDHL